MAFQIQLIPKLPGQAFELQADRQQLEQALINILQTPYSIQSSSTIELILDPAAPHMC